MSSKHAIAFLDRDGTLVGCNVENGIPVPAHHDLQLADDAEAACALLKGLGFWLVLVTNQPDVARGTIGRETVEAANRQLAEQLGLDLTLVCMHDDLDRCACRKPRPGLLLEGAAALGVDLDRSSVMIGDRWRDVDAGIAAGVTSILVDRGHGELLNARPDRVASSLLDAAEWVGTNLTTRSNR